MSKGKHDPDWIEDGEKYALVGVSLQTDPDLGRLDLPSGVTVLPNADFKLPEFWRAWLGTVQTENVERCMLFLLAKVRSKAPGILDGENQLLQKRVGNFFLGLNLVKKFTAFDKPFMSTGSRIAGEVDVRQFGEMDRPVGSIVADTAPIGEGQLREAEDIGNALQAFDGPWQPNHWRFFRCHSIYHTTRTNLDMLDRIHQFTRCVEGPDRCKEG